MKTILFAWELGSGAGHLVNIRRLAQRLQRPDIRLVAAVKRLDSVALLDNINEIHRVPNWPIAAIDPRTGGEPSSATMTDTLVTVGLANTAAVREMVTSWDELFRRVGPDMVIADYAPGASLAARGRIPLMQIGSGFTLPPHDMETFPPLHDLSPPVYRDDEVLAGLNPAMQQLGRPPLERLPQLFEGDARLVYTAPVIDPYGSRRHPPADGPLLDYQPRERDADAQRVFVYVTSDMDVRPDLIAAMKRVASRAWIHAPRLSPDTEQELTQAGAHIVYEHIPLSEALPRCRLVVHGGGSGFGMEAALAGVPQLTLVTHVEQHLISTVLERMGVSRPFLAYDPALRLSADIIENMLRDDTLDRSAREAGVRLRAELPAVPAGQRFDAECRRLLA